MFNAADLYGLKLETGTMKIMDVARGKENLFHVTNFDDIFN
jgi:hypothetical protein